MLLKADYVRTLRLQKGWTQEHLAELCGISVRTVQRLEKTGIASLETTGALASVFDVDRVALLADDELPPAIAVVERRRVYAVGAIMFLLGALAGTLFSQPTLGNSLTGLMM